MGRWLVRGQSLTTAIPAMLVSGTGPNSLLSVLCARLSPSTMHSPDPTRHEREVAPKSAGRPKRYGSRWCSPLTWSMPSSNETWSSGRPTTRLICHRVSEPLGRSTTTTSPRCGARLRLLTSSTSPSNSEGSMLDPRTMYRECRRSRGRKSSSPPQVPYGER